MWWWWWLCFVGGRVPTSGTGGAEQQGAQTHQNDGGVMGFCRQELADVLYARYV